MADGGDSDSLALLGCLYYTGTDVPRDERKGATYMVSAVAKKNVTATNMLAQMYRCGIGVVASETRAIKLFKSAIEYGCHDAQVGLAESLIDSINAGTISVKDLPRAYKHVMVLLQTAMTSDDVIAKAHAYYVMSLCYQNGIGCEINEKLAREYRDKATSDGYDHKESCWQRYVALGR